MKKRHITLFTCCVLTFLSICCWDNSVSAQTASKESATTEKLGFMDRSDRKIISDLIKKTIQDGLDGKKISYPNLADYPEKWRVLKNVYTTLNIGSNLRGCRGNLDSKKPFLYAIVDSAYDAAFNDHRFQKLTQEEFNHPDFYFYITVFGDKKALSFKNEQDIVKNLKPFRYGYILSYTAEDGAQKRGLFLPSVWKKNPDPEQFWKRLKRKATLKDDFFSNRFQVSAFSGDTIRDLDITMAQDTKRIQQALSAYKKLFQENGHIRYEVDFKDGTLSDKTNLVREMGSGYGLAYAYYITHDETLYPILSRFLTYVNSITVPYQNGLLISDDPNKISAGASALALLAALYYEQGSQDSTFQQLASALKNGLVALFEPGVGIHSSPTTTETSPYYDGETWLALTMYQIFHPEDQALAQIIPTLNQTMYDKYSDNYLYNFFHWGTQAAAHSYAQTQDPLMHDFLEKQLNIYIDTIPFHANHASCSYAEGLGEAALALQNRDDALYQKVLERLENQIDIARLLQDIPLNKKRAIAESSKPFLGLFLSKTHTLLARSDITQHCLSALLKARLVFQSVP